jgi:hypothetical protein
MKGQSGSWLSLVTLCAAAALFTALGLGMLFAGASAVFAVAAPSSAGSDDPSQGNAQKVGTEATPQASLSQQSSEIQAGQNSAPNSAPQANTFSGMITDSHCGARHTRYADMTSAECARLCVRSKGSHYVLVDGEAIHGLDGDRTQLDRMATMRVDVVGKLVGDTIKVESIAAR